MFVWLVAQLLYTTAPHCSLLVGTEHAQGRGILKAGVVTADAPSRLSYRLETPQGQVMAQTFGEPLLMSLTLKASSQQPTASFTCTQKKNQQSVQRVRAPYVMCTTGGETSWWGRGQLSFTVNDMPVQVRADSRELRISVSDPRVGFVAAWRERRADTNAPLLLETGAQSVLCLVL